MAYEEILRTWQEVLRKVGIRHGDMLYVASDASLLLLEARKKCGVKTATERNVFLNAWLDTLQDVVGTKGTLLFPVFSWDFCHGKGFNIKNTLGEVGALNNWVLQNRVDFHRTKHPLYSFMVWGNRADELLALNNVDAWGGDSPFAYLHQNSGKMLLLNVSLQRGFTFMHYVEQAVSVPYRYMKNFRGMYTDVNGIESERSYTMYVRDLAIKSQEYAPDEMLEVHGIVERANWGNLIVKAFDLKKSFDIVSDDLVNNAGKMCYKFTNYEIEWNKEATHADDLSN
ncbi:aminoglycoside 3-N-acetyltransferase [Selenomonas sp. GACV-9]|uniref:AAC(3) family N-acetyltransferase n=1 Tax=Selenomonas sp. GACV-9 TaxID=3158782 RepID=UPI0008E3908C|nr:aminoglycoside 3-N-acetyltransferase [Selenomonas ruminantium]